MKNKIDKIRNRIEQTALSCGRNPLTVRLVAVSKTVPPENVKAAVDAGVFIFGENYIQEAMNKIEEIGDSRLSWHFIGHLQSNKAKYVVRYFDLIHSVDTLKLAQEINRQAKKLNKTQNILVQVNIAMEVTKSGVATKDTISLIKDISKLENLSVKGLMTMPPFFNQPEKVRPYFKTLAQLKDQILEESIEHIEMKELSMGMTGDFEVAIEEGATLVRIGTAIFGDRS
ncbi:MAG: YggS family pyridoxal phosphate-dependent enzyme [Desulfobacteraceae bacterium]|nr:YggS family pyridoxal phosphate-dependent enzyme [Desulfobacteraceae bacterium]MBC2755913.1 YggS family pyridoxal phosphate-dependent enzyme [Desulfobacteraceae bacterium]